MSNDPKDPKGFDMSGVEAALARLSDVGYDSAAAHAEVAEAARESAGSLHAPPWWKASIARFNEAEGAPEMSVPPPTSRWRH